MRVALRLAVLGLVVSLPASLAAQAEGAIAGQVREAGTKSRAGQARRFSSTAGWAP